MRCGSVFAYFMKNQDSSGIGWMENHQVQNLLNTKLGIKMVEKLT